MMKVMDNSGNVISGVYKDNLGNLIVGNDAEYQRYMFEKQQQETINNLSNEIINLKTLVTNLLSVAVINKDSNKDTTENNNG